MCVVSSSRTHGAHRRPLRSRRHRRRERRHRASGCESRERPDRPPAWASSYADRRLAAPSANQYRLQRERWPETPEGRRARFRSSGGPSQQQIYIYLHIMQVDVYGPFQKLVNATRSTHTGFRTSNRKNRCQGGGESVVRVGHPFFQIEFTDPRESVRPRIESGAGSEVWKGPRVNSRQRPANHPT